MSSEVATILAILIVVLLVILFVVSFVIYVKTPPPKGCERLPKDKEACMHCDNEGCKLYVPKGALKPQEEENKEDVGHD